MKIKIFYLIIFFFPVSLFASTSLPQFFSDGMVLQQNSDVAIWGKDKPGQLVKLSTQWNENVTALTGEDGKWKMKVLTPKAGGPFTLKIEGSTKVILQNVMIGEVWVCSGQSNMAMTLRGLINQPVENSNDVIIDSSNPSIRMFTLEKNASLNPVDEVNGTWQEADISTTGDFSAVAYFYGKKLQEVLNVPVGVIVSAWGGSTIESWMDLNTAKSFDEIKIPEKLPETYQHRTATLLFNGMISPLIGYTIKGCIWYQGENNVRDAVAYKNFFPALITNWRKKWELGNFPFYFVQIAPFDYGENNAAFLRETQLKTMLSVDNTGMAVTLDIGNCKGIHPNQKKQVGNRLAYWAITKTYNLSGIDFSGPVYKSLKKSDNKLILDFYYTANGLVNKDNKTTDFQIAGIDKIFYPAKVQINRDKTITIWSDKVKTPVSARYSFNNCAEGTLYNTAGLPASSFRTDDWDK